MDLVEREVQTLNLPPGSRPERLFQRLEASFQRFWQQLPAGLQEVAGQRTTYHGDGGGEPFDGLGGFNPVLVGTPWLFWESFQRLEDERILEIARAGAFFVLASVVLDHLVDGQTREPGLLALYHQALYSQGVAGYRQAFPTPGLFWEVFDRLAEEHLAGLAAETRVQTYPEAFPLETLIASAQGKVAPIVATLLGLCAACEQMEIFPALETSLKSIAVASQLLDDIGDWQTDVQDRHLTYFLALLDSPEAWRQEQWPEVGRLQRTLEADWTDVTGLKMVRQGLDQAIEAVEGLQCPDWVHYVDGYRVLTDEHLERIIRGRLQRAFAGMQRAQNT